jgi:hypothetical protein
MRHVFDLYILHEFSGELSKGELGVDLLDITVVQSMNHSNPYQQDDFYCDKVAITLGSPEAEIDYVVGGTVREVEALIEEAKTQEMLDNSVWSYLGIDDERKDGGDKESLLSSLQSSNSSKWTITTTSNL